jgi:predicted nucleic acid-binding protein
LTLIIDASVALKWYLSDEPHAAEARAILDAGEPLIAPDIVIAEVCNAAWRGARVGRVSKPQAQSIARSLPGLFDILVGGSVLVERGIVIAGELDHAVYDCFYLALAEARQIQLVTADARLLAKLRGTAWASHGVSLADYAR